MASWTCSRCKRTFARKNQRHACGTGERSDVLRDRPEQIVRLYASVEAFARTLGTVEFVTRNKKFSHVAKLRTQQDFNALKRYLKEAYVVSLARPAPAAD